MSKEIRLPEISENVDTGDVVKVMVAVGDAVEVDQPLLELETEKAVFEVPSTVAGTVAEILVSEGDTVKVGEVLLRIDESGESAGAGEAGEADAGGDEDEEEKKSRAEDEEEKKSGADDEEKKKSRADDEEKKKPGADDEESKESDDEADEEDAQEAPPAREEDDETKDEGGDEADEPSEPAPASPSVRRLARELGIDIHDVEGSGPGGRISDEDVQAHAKRIITGSGGKGAVAPGVASSVQLPDFTQWGEVEREPMSKVRSITATSMAAAWNTVPHVTQYDKSDITDTEANRKRYGKKAEEAGGKLTMTAILVKVVAAALKVFPEFNASVDVANQQIIYKKYINIGIAVDTDRGLLVPVIKDADQKSMIDVSVELSEVAEKARTKKIKPDEMEGGNFTVSNLGGIGGTYFSPIVYAPEVAILGVSRATLEPVHRDGEFVPRLMLPLSLSYDHRLIDGANAARFIRWVSEALENPFLVVMEG